MTIINLDALSGQLERVVKFRGETYEVRDFSVTDYIAMAKLQTLLGEIDEDDIESLVGASLKIVKFGLPDLPDIESLNYRQITALMTLIVTMSEPGDEQGKDQGETQDQPQDQDQDFQEPTA